MGEKKTKDELGGWKVHTKNGTVDNGADDEVACIDEIKRFLSYMPDNINQLAPVLACDDPIDRCDASLLDVVPRDRRVAFEMRAVVKAVFDKDSFFEMGKGYGRSQITGLARLNGQTVGRLGQRL
jgi:acetyl-CoA carboxylase carboxyltransferase component